jgi:hypothetical protein
MRAARREGCNSAQTNLDNLHRTAADPAAHRAFLMRTSPLESIRKQAPAT